MFEPECSAVQDREQHPEHQGQERMQITPAGARMLDEYMRSLRLIDELHVARGNVIDMPHNLREQLRIECLSFADAAHELTRLERAS